ncbi:MAG: CRISPR-associated helicase/endonuclease Cas3 [Gammaproteobacteria bacterium]|nr:CRISPR-associated helicase/endonuclease Cas3 [Gammaproteobacteria bacterium]MBU1962881.1 CRISPR-associated helicase/endonuclease Cas3 [Gammaproteobacteria bacterium]
MSEAMIFKYWGKADKEGRCHLLPYHCLDVAAVAWQWWSRSPALRQRLCYETRLGEEATLAWVLFFIALHDLGKFDIRFQLKALAALAAVWPGFTEDQADPEPGFSHGPAGLYWFRKELAGSLLSETQTDCWRPWVQAVAGHHGNLTPNGRLGEIGRPDAEEPIGVADRNARRAWIEALTGLFLAPAGLGLDDLPPPCPELIAGLCSVSDWLGSNEEFFPYRADPIPLQKFWEDIQDKAAQAFAESGLFQAPLAEGGMEAVFPDLAPRQVQTLVDQLPDSPGLTLIEAPTGSGKTEAALAYAARLLAAGHADAVVFALPTQATANAMFERLERIAPRLFPGGANLLLAHGKAGYNRNFQALKAAKRPTVQGDEEALAQCVAWLGASRKRALLGQIGVCTIDQVLLSVLPVRHQFVRAFGVRKAVLIVDEVHAYDAYMYGLLHRVLEGQGRAGGSALLLSATLPAHQRAVLCKAWNPKAELPEANSYPLVTHLDGQRVSLHELEEADLPPPRRVALATWQAPDLLPDPARCEEIVAAARAGALVGIVCNLVNDAQGLAERLRGLAGPIPVDLFHARFRFADRMAREEEVIARYGKEAPRGQGRILVATQVIEQSLDLDFDWLITQLCPVDLLFQRLGRLHRHPRTRPAGFESARCTVLMPTVQGDGMPDYGLHGVIYDYLRVLWRTQQLIDGHATVEFPAAYREWIEAVYREQPMPQESAAVTRTAERFFKEQEGRFFAARQFSVTAATPLADTDGNAARLTRDGEMSLPVVLLQEAKAKTLLDSRRLNAIDEAERDEALDLNTVHVPNSWHDELPKADKEGRHWLSMRKNADGWWEAANGLLYHEKVGLVRR